MSTFGFLMFLVVSKETIDMKWVNDQCFHHTETSQLICSAYQMTGFYMMGTLVVKGLNLKYKQNNKRILRHLPSVFY